MRFEVAGHIFQIRGTEFYDSVRSRIQIPYGPFALKEDEKCDKQPLFYLQLQEDHVSWGNHDLVFSNVENPHTGFITISVYKSIQEYHFEFTHPGSKVINGKLSFNREFSLANLALYGSDEAKWQTFNTAVNFCYLLASSAYRTVLVHASCVMYNGKAYLFLGKSGTGKSTHSRMWLSALQGVILMNDDHPVIRVNDAGHPIAYGTPWSGKTPCYKNINAPVGGIIRISRANNNRISRFSPIHSYASLISSCAGMIWEKELADNRDNTIQDIIKTVPCWVMECLPNKEAAIVCSNVVTIIN